MFNLDQYQAFKLMLDGKKVINELNFIYGINKEKNLIETNVNTIKDYSEFLKMQPYKFKEYIEPRKYIFETYVGENFGVMPFGKCPMEVALKHQCSGLNDDYDNLKSMYKKVSKVKVTLEFIEKDSSDFVFPEIPFRRL
jgi:hypothetical protein